MNKFTFLVITYNHEEYILEHLESIKYQIDNYGTNLLVDLIIADDGSKDETVSICNFWLEENSNLFNSYKVLSDGKNRGTCKNLSLALEYLESNKCKITAGDDVYSYENLFEEFSKIKDYDILSGLPLNLIDNKIMNSKFDLFNFISTNIIYKNTNYLDRLKKINFFNAPSIIYNTKALQNHKIIKFMESFIVTEDFPLQIKMSEIYSPLKFKQIDKIFIYYRRTSNSTYIIKNSIFDQDKIKIFKYLIDNENNIISKLLLKNRLFSYTVANRYLKKISNLNVYIYFFKIFMRIIPIIKKFNSIDIDYSKHQKHSNLINKNAKIVLDKYKNRK